MQHLEDDMNELFQRAAEQYHLDAGQSAWDSISSRLSEPGKSAVVVHKNEHGFLRFRFALAVMLLGIIGMTYPKVCMDPVQFRLAVADDSERNSITALVNTNERYYTPAGTSYDHPDFSASKISGGSVHDALNKNSTGFSVNYVNTVHSPYPKLQTIGTQQWLEGDDGNVNTEDKTTGTGDTISDLEPLLLQDSDPATSNKPAEKEQIKPLSKISAEKTAAEKITKVDRWYAGVFTITDASKVRSMPFKNIGFGEGVLLGYNINSKLSIEASFALQQKKYDTYGKDFSLDKIGSSMPAGMIIEKLHSITSVAAFSLGIRYKVIEHKRASIYGSVALSAYDVTREENAYSVSLNGNRAMMKGMYKANNAKLPAVVGFAVVYAYQINKKTAVRVEPYLKVPIQGIGVGSVPVTSAGVQLGITRSLR
ncbi:MAG: hypothetical protein ABIN36_04370 [Ferruginibacter sp.]